MNNILLEDIAQFAAAFPFRERVSNKTFLITGATGLIGSTLIRCLVALDEQVHIIAPVRNAQKLHDLLGEEAQHIQAIECDLMSFDFNTLGPVDYVFHCAAPTASSFFVNHPVETSKTIYNITDHILQMAVNKPLLGIIYLSSLEVYGSNLGAETITEDMQGYWNPLDVRSSYPIAKRAAENLCRLYASQYNVPVKIARLTQTTGAGIDKQDNRIINQFARLASLNQDIILHSTGESARPYCYTIDCINALFYLLFKGQNGNAYNVANKNTYISARDLAQFVKEHFAPSIQVRIELDNNKGYAPASMLNLSTAKLEALGWKPQYDLKQILNQLIKYMQSV
ncbi:MAG: NAD(P)-dependent oxidoreductase [Paludibacteraceae bacterium]|nr:NAD(P)-dependent oxidoreductase [Paludibacteraceae bacterium]